MDYDEIYELMMDALDGELSEAGHAELESHLRARPELVREWQALQTVDALFRSSPVLRPAVDFKQRTVARLPSSRQRLWVGVMLYLVLLASGIIPLAAIIWITVQFIPALGQPAIFKALVQGGAEFSQLVGVILSALLQGAGEFVNQQPVVLTGLVLMVAVIALWLNVYHQLVLQPHRRQS